MLRANTPVLASPAETGPSAVLARDKKLAREGDKGVEHGTDSTCELRTICFPARYENPRVRSNLHEPNGMSLTSGRGAPRVAGLTCLSSQKRMMSAPVLGD